MGGVGFAAGKLGQAILEFVFPARCVVCGGGDTFLCDGCARSLPAASPPRCAVCWRPASAPDPCSACRRDPPPFDGLRAAFVYQGPVRTIVQRLKYRGTTALAPPMAALMAATVRDQDLPVDAVVPVPLAGLRRRTRGYNQAQVLARALARELGLPLRARALERRRGAPPQARAADADERRRNVAGAFRARAAEAQGARALLVDDVTTTGATFAACAEALKQGGARSVWALAFARED